ncbi:unnamed protein product [Amoebophrya sp. A120]|nr:unnamed protein product [Amoebophrya sp. A120]|eukprot:GSA120T00003239001.1
MRASPSDSSASERDPPATSQKSITLIDQGLASLRDVRCPGTSSSSSCTSLNLHCNRIRALDLRDVHEVFPNVKELILSSNEIDVGVSVSAPRSSASSSSRVAPSASDSGAAPASNVGTPSDTDFEDGSTPSSSSSSCSCRIETLDLGCNRIGPTLTNLHLMKSSLLHLIVPYNQLRSLDGLKPLWGGPLQSVDVRCNLLDRLDQLFFLSGLRNLTRAALEPNPMCNNALTQTSGDLNTGRSRHMPMHRLGILQLVPSIEAIDNVAVGDDERVIANGSPFVLIGEPMELALAQQHHPQSSSSRAGPKVVRTPTSSSSRRMSAVEEEQVDHGSIVAVALPNSATPTPSSRAKRSAKSNPWAAKNGPTEAGRQKLVPGDSPEDVAAPDDAMEVEGEGDDLMEQGQGFPQQDEVQTQAKESAMEKKLRLDLIKIDAEFQRREKKRFELEGRLRENTKVVEHLLKENLDLRGKCDALNKTLHAKEEEEEKKKLERDSQEEKATETQLTVAEATAKFQKEVAELREAKDLAEKAQLRQREDQEQAFLAWRNEKQTLEQKLQKERGEYDELKAQSERTLRDLQTSVADISARMHEQDRFFQESLATERDKFAADRKRLESERATLRDEVARLATARETAQADFDTALTRDRDAARIDFEHKLSSQRVELDSAWSAKLRELESTLRRDQDDAKRESELKLQRQNDELTAFYAEKLSRELEEARTEDRRRLSRNEREWSDEYQRKIQQMEQRHKDAVNDERAKVERDWKQMLRECLAQAKTALEEKERLWVTEKSELEGAHHKQLAELKLTVEKLTVEKAQAQLLLEDEQRSSARLLAEAVARCEEQKENLRKEHEIADKTSRKVQDQLISDYEQKLSELQTKLRSGKEEQTSALLALEAQHEKKLLARLHAQRADFENVELKLKQVQVEDLTKQLADAVAQASRFKEEQMESRKKRDRDWQTRVDEEVALQKALQAEVESWKAEKQEQIERLELDKTQLEEQLLESRTENFQAAESAQKDLQDLRAALESEYEATKVQHELDWKKRLQLAEGRAQQETSALRQQNLALQEAVGKQHAEVRSRDKEVAVLLQELQKQKSTVKDRVKALLQNLDE